MRSKSVDVETKVRDESNIEQLQFYLHTSFPDIQRTTLNVRFDSLKIQEARKVANEVW